MRSPEAPRITMPESEAADTPRIQERWNLDSILTMIGSVVVICMISIVLIAVGNHDGNGLMVNTGIALADVATIAPAVYLLVKAVGKIREYRDRP